MLYNSYIFILAYLPIVLIGWYVLNKLKVYNAALGWLVISSLFFYGYFNWSYLPIIIISVIANYILSMLIRPNAKYGLDNKIRKLFLIFKAKFPKIPANKRIAEESKNSLTNINVFLNSKK